MRRRRACSARMRSMLKPSWRAMVTATLMAGSVKSCRTPTRPTRPTRVARISSGWVVSMYGRRPRCKENLTFSELVGCSHVFGLFVRHAWPLALM